MRQYISDRHMAPAWVFTALAWIVFICAVKLFLAANLDLFGDEAFYRWEAQHLAWSYSDLPPLTALAINGGMLVGGESVLAVRSVFLLSGLMLPLAVVFLAYPIVGRGRALVAAGFLFLLPFTLAIGPLAFPDTLLLTECTLVLGAIERATRTHGNYWWVMTGILGCLGFLTHYRFVFLPLPLAAAFLYYPMLRIQLRGSGPWVAVGIATLGLIPALMFNLGNDFAAVGFHFSERHPWAWHPEGLQYALLQAGAVSPLLYGLMWVALWQSLRSARQGSVAQALLSAVSLFYLPGLVLLAPWIDQTSTTVHWALFGYIPMLVLLPDVMIRLWHGGRVSRYYALASVLLAAGLITASLAAVVAPVYYDSLPQMLRKKLSVKMVGWDKLRKELAPFYVRGETVYTTSYYIAAQLRQLPFNTGEVRVIDHAKIHRDGRGMQLQLWQVTEQFMPADGSSGLIIVDYQSANRFESYRQIDVLCRSFERIETLAEFSYFDGRRRYGVYRGYSAAREFDYVQHDTSNFCLPPVLGRVENYAEFGELRSGVVAYHGYLLAQPEGVASFKVRVAGREFPGNYGLSRKDVKRVLGDKVIDPQYPLSGFEGEFDTQELSNGTYEMEFIGVTHTGREGVFRRYSITVAN